jgi:toxin ParE1/3/4
MARYKLTNKAVEDLTQIWNYTFNEWSENQADTYYHMLLENCKELASNLNLGKNYSEVTQNLLGFKAGRHLIFYRRIEENEIEITRILHEQMDLKNRIKEK